MDAHVFSEKDSQPERYINRPAATIIVLFKVFDGVVAGFFLFHLFRVFYQMTAVLAARALDITQALQMFLIEYGVPQQTINEITGLTIGGVTLPIIFWFGLFLVIFIGLFLAVIEALVLIALRIAKKGAIFIRVIHQIYMVVYLMYVVLLGIIIYSLFTFKPTGDTTTREAVLTLRYPLIIVGIIALFFLFLHFCYHKDIAMAMGTVAYEIETGKQGKLRRTHLSGISFLFSLPYVLNVISIIATIIGVRYSSISLPDDYSLSTAQVISAVSIPFIMIVKYLSVCFCNRNLKRARS